MIVSGVPPAAIAAVVGEARAFLRMADGEEPLLVRLAASAVEIAEAFTGTLLIARGVEERVAGGGWQLLGAGPVSAISEAGGASIDIDADGRGWVRAADAAVVRYVAGLAPDWAALPAPLAQGVVMLVAHLFDDRGGMAQPPAAVAALWRPYRQVRL